MTDRPCLECKAVDTVGAYCDTCRVWLAGQDTAAADLAARGVLGARASYDARLPDAGRSISHVWLEGYLMVLEAAERGLAARRLEVVPEGCKALKVSVLEMVQANADDDWLVGEVLALEPGQSVRFGGGAAPTVDVTRLEAEPC